MKKNLFSIMLLIAMIAALMVSATGCNAENDAALAEANQRIAELVADNAALQAQLDELTAAMDREADRLALAAALQDWTLTADAWNDGNGATVTFTATPVAYAEGLRAALSVRVGDLEAESTNCVWDGTSFSGSVELSAADGYGYYCVLTNPDGSQSEVDLNSPENVTDESLVYLGSSLTAYANMIVEDWSAANGVLTINSGYIQAQMPRLSAGGIVPSVSKADLVLQLNGEEVSRQELTLSAGEGDSSYEATLSGSSFTIPVMEDEYQLDLWLEITLNNGNVVTASGGSWYSSSGELQLVVG